MIVIMIMIMIMIKIMIMMMMMMMMMMVIMIMIITTGAPELIKSLNESSQYQFLGVLENKKQEDNMVLENVEKE